MILQYSVPGNKGAASVRTIVGVDADATTPRRGSLSEYQVGAVASADAAFDHEIARVSGAVTGAVVTPSPNDPNESAAVFDAVDTVTADYTVGVILKRFGMHQRSSFRWVGNPGEELIWPATGGNGLAGILAAESTTDFSASMQVLSV